MHFPAWILHQLGDERFDRGISLFGALICVNAGAAMPVASKFSWPLAKCRGREIKLQAATKLVEVR